MREPTRAMLIRVASFLVLFLCTLALWYGAAWLAFRGWRAWR